MLEYIGIGIFTIIVITCVISGVHGYRHVNPVLFRHPKSRTAKIISASDYIVNTLMVILGVTAIGFVVFTCYFL